MTIGFAENLATSPFRPMARPTCTSTPSLWWQEVTASDICVLDEDARVRRGRRDVTPAIHIHTGCTPRPRPGCAWVVIHNHPYYVCVLAALGLLPELVHQTGSLFLDDLLPGRRIRRRGRQPFPRGRIGGRIGAANTTILANHGVIVTGHNLAEAVYLAASIERVCKLAYDVLLTGLKPSDEVVRHGRHEVLLDRARGRRVLAGCCPHDHQPDPSVLQ